MLDLLKIDKPVRVNGTVYNSLEEAREAFKGFTGKITLEINFEESQAQTADKKPAPQEKQPHTAKQGIQDSALYEITVKQWMTKEATPSFDFHTKYNDDKPMPMRTMEGRILSETKGMYKMELNGIARPSSHCNHCGRKITNPVSLMYGLGVICGGHFGVTKLDNEEAVKANYEQIKAKMAAVKWVGWIAKSAIQEMEKVTANNEEQAV